jgi:hypothetical protein
MRRRAGGRLALTTACEDQRAILCPDRPGELSPTAGGNVFLPKRALKAKGAELKRLEWEGDRIERRFGTGAEPSFRPAALESKLSVLEDHLPVAIATWTTGTIEYREEAFATALCGPLGWEGRDEQSPVVLMVKFTARNTADHPQPSHLWLGLVGPAVPGTPDARKRRDQRAILAAV